MNGPVSTSNYRLAILLARQRSGTNVLTACLNSHPELKAYGEILNIPLSGEIDLSESITERIDTENDNLDGSFFPYWLKLQRESERTYVTALGAFEELLALIEERGPARHKTVDIKYNSVRVIQDLWPPLQGTPAMFEVVKNRGYGLLHLTRMNYLAGIISWTKAEATGVWDVPTGKQSSTCSVQVRLDPGELMRALEYRKREDEYIIDQFAGYRNYIRVDYSEMFESDGNISGELMGRIAALFGVGPNFDHAPKFGKVGTRNLIEAIENADEIESTLKGTEFEYCLQS